MIPQPPTSASTSPVLQSSMYSSVVFWLTSVHERTSLMTTCAAAGPTGRSRKAVSAKTLLARGVLRERYIVRSFGTDKVRGSGSTTASAHAGGPFSTWIAVQKN